MNGDLQVRGELTKELIPDRVVEDFVDYLSSRGYSEIESRSDGSMIISFRKRSRIENVLNELVPKIEQLGCNAWRDLVLEEHDGGNITSRYRRGRLERD